MLNLEARDFSRVRLHNTSWGVPTVTATPLSYAALRAACAEADMRANEKMYGCRARTVRVKETTFKDILVPEEEIKKANKKYQIRCDRYEEMAGKTIFDGESDARLAIVGVYHGEPQFAAAGSNIFGEICDGSSDGNGKTPFYDSRHSALFTYEKRAD